MTSVLDGLEAEILIAREHDSRDRRSVAVMITPAGRKRLHTVLADQARWLVSLTESLNRAEADSLNRTVVKLLRVWDQDE